MALVEALRKYDPRWFEQLHEWVTPERLYHYLKAIADTPAPSGTARWTRSPVVEQLLRDDGVLLRPGVRYVRNHEKTGGSALLLGREATRKQIWLLAHLDVISYLVEPQKDGRYPLTPWCYHLMKPGRRSAQAMAYALETGRLELAALGEIVVEPTGGIFFEAGAGLSVRAGQRIVFQSELAWNRATGQLQGVLDDAGAVAALAVAVGLLARYPMELLLGLTDEEEGIEGLSNQTIGRGGARLLRHFDQPDLVIVSDMHEAAPMVEGQGPNAFSPGDGASFAEKSSRARGAVTPPPLYELLRHLAAELKNEGISLCENLGGYVSRSEDVNAARRTPNITLIGFLGTDRHFDTAVPSANMNDLINLAKAVACLVALTQTPRWAELGLSPAPRLPLG